MLVTLLICIWFRVDPRLRGVRFGEQIEATAWYVLAEALTNVVKHAGASEVEVSLSQEAGRLGLVIRDNGCGCDLTGHAGLGWPACPTAWARAAR